jgi:hypothetical protein
MIPLAVFVVVIVFPFAFRFVPVTVCIIAAIGNIASGKTPFLAKFRKVFSAVDVKRYAIGGWDGENFLELLRETG